MLSSNNRLIKKNDFTRIFKQGHFSKENILLLRFCKNNLEITRFGFIVSQKVSKKAVVRNRIKRRFREIVKTNIKKIEPGFDILIIAKPLIIEKKYQEIKDIIEKVLKDNRLL